MMFLKAEGGRSMSTAYFKVQKQFCGECSLALRRFIGGMDGVQGVNVETGMVAVEFDEQRIGREDLTRITRDSIERLGYRVDEE
jgi:copper chaperone CopZ